MSLDIMIAVSILVLTTVFASYTVISAFVPYSVHDIDLQASAYRVAMILSEDGGIWYENGSVSSEWSEKVWQNPQGISEHLKRIGLANSSKLANLSYERCIPCYLNGSKVDTFFNRSLWESVWGENWRDKLAYLIGLNSSVRHYRYNVSICYMNGSVVNGWSIGYRMFDKEGGFIPTTFGKFERLVVIDGEYDPNGDQDPSSYLRKLVVYVW